MNNTLAPFALDIGGTLTKVVYIDYESVEDKIKFLKKSRKNIPKERVTRETLTTDMPEFVNYCPVIPFDLSKASHPNLDIHESIKGGVLKFLEFPNTHLEEFITFIKDNLLLERFGKYATSCNCTGGGAYKYVDEVKKLLGLDFVKCDEIKSSVEGLNFLLTAEGIKDKELFTFHNKKQEFITIKNVFPYLLVQVGSGCSIIKVDDENTFERVCGTSIGGGTFSGLARMLTGTHKFDEWIKMAQTGDNRNVDLLVGDIYGGDYEEMGLKKEVIASSFGKMATMKIPDNESIDKYYNKADAIRSLLFAISNNIAQIASLNGEKYKVKNIFFSGGFIRSSSYVWSTLDFAMQFFSNGKQMAIFLKHDGYLGALGALFHRKKDIKV